MAIPKLLTTEQLAKIMTQCYCDGVCTLPGITIDVEGVAEVYKEFKNKLENENFLETILTHITEELEG